VLGPVLGVADRFLQVSAVAMSSAPTTLITTAFP
jgi:hypothetical protein